MARHDEELLAAIDREIAKLQHARELLAGTEEPAAKPARPSPAAGRRPGRPAGVKRQLSPEARARIAAAQKKRWAKNKQQKQTEEAAAD